MGREQEFAADFIKMKVIAAIGNRRVDRHSAKDIKGPIDESHPVILDDAFGIDAMMAGDEVFKDIEEAVMLILPIPLGHDLAKDVILVFFFAEDDPALKDIALIFVFEFDEIDGLLATIAS